MIATTICTSIEQSKKLLEIGIPIDSADFAYLKIPNSSAQRFNYSDLPYITELIANREHKLPCWSLSALLELVPAELVPTISKGSLEEGHKDDYFAMLENDDYLEYVFNATNPIDAMVELIVKLKKEELI